MPTPAELFDQAARLYQGGSLAQAEPLLRQIVQADARHAHAHHLLGLFASQTGRPDVGVPLLRQAIVLDPAAHAFHSNLGIALAMQGKHAEAVDCFRQALRLNPDYANARFHLALALNNRGVALEEQGQGPAALPCFQEAVALNPDYVEAQNNLGNMLKEEGDYTGAAQCYEHALRVDPNNAIARWNRSFLRLFQGDLAGAWPDFELRWSMPRAAPPVFEQPRWDGSPLAGKTVLVYTESGLGDTLQFIRYLPFVKECGGTVIFACQKPLVKLLANIPGVDRLTVAGAPWPSCDVQISLLSLPGLFGTTLANIPTGVPYLFADPVRVAYWRRVAVGTGLNIGIAWDSNPNHKEHRFRSIPLKYFEALAEIDGVRLVSLQKGPGTEQLATWRGRTPILDLGERLDADAPFLDTAAVMMNLDLVVSVDTAIPHLAGALGVRAWVAMQYASDWRWLLEREDSPWYPTLRLFRNRLKGNWAEVFERIAAELKRKERGVRSEE